jgi:hypothetical protein
VRLTNHGIEQLGAVLSGGNNEFIHANELGKAGNKSSFFVLFRSENRVAYKWFFSVEQITVGSQLPTNGYVA